MGKKERSGNVGAGGSHPSGKASSVGSYGSKEFAYAATSVISGISNGGNSSSKSGPSTRRSSRRNRVTLKAPPGKLGIVLANNSDNTGTIVSGVRNSSPLFERIFPGDRIVGIDGEDVSRMTVSEITTIMARKGEFERILTVLTTVKPQTPSKAGSIEFENKF